MLVERTPSYNLAASLLNTDSNGIFFIGYCDPDTPGGQLLANKDDDSFYFNAFDCSIQAGGYNSFHEVRRFGLPTLFYPNLLTGMDDQLGRCMVSTEEGWGQVLEQRNKSSIRESVNLLIQRAGKSEPLDVESGAIKIAKELVKR